MDVRTGRANRRNNLHTEGVILFHSLSSLVTGIVSCNVEYYYCYSVGWLMGSRAYDSWIDWQFSVRLRWRNTANVCRRENFLLRFSISPCCIVVVLVVVVAVVECVRVQCIFYLIFRNEVVFAPYEKLWLRCLRAPKENENKNNSANNICFTLVMPLICDQLVLLTFPLKLRKSTDWYACKWQLEFLSLCSAVQDRRPTKKDIARYIVRANVVVCANIIMCGWIWMDTSTY